MNIVLVLDRSNPSNLHLERNGKTVSLEDAFREGFMIRPDDANAILTLAANFVKTRGEFAM